MSDNNLQNEIKAAAKELLEKGEVGYFIGFGKARFLNKTVVKFIFHPEDADKLVFDKDCVPLLPKYLLDDRYPKGKIGILVRGCDSRAVNRMLKDNQVKRENLYLLGVPCTGMEENGQAAEKCLSCTSRNPVVYDKLLGSPAPETEKGDRFSEVKKMEAMTADERYQFWSKAFEKCIRCYACRNVCPACNCVECYSDQYRTGWQGKQMNGPENQIYAMTRAYHCGDRCIECGECERVCPMGLPLMLLNRKLVKDTDELFGSGAAGMDAETVSALGKYEKNDVEEFM